MPKPARTKLTELSNPWPAIRELDRPKENPVPQKERHLGHPTVAGLRDEGVVRAGGPSPGNGTPGVPRIQPGRRKPGVMGGGFGSSQVNDSLYDGPHDF